MNQPPQRLRKVVVLALFALVSASARAADTGNRPFNVLFLMTDQHRASALGCAGNPVVQTPNLDRLATGGVRFTNSFCVVPYCSPTRLALVTGRYPSSQGLGRNIGRETDNEDPLRLREPCETYMHRLAALGYHCHQVGKWHIGDPGELSCYPEAKQDEAGPGDLLKKRNRTVLRSARVDEAQRPGEVQLVGNVWIRAEVQAQLNLNKAKGTQRGKPADQEAASIGRSVVKPEFTREAALVDYCVELLKRHKHEPFAIMCSLSPPHAPNVVPSPFYDMYDPATPPLPATWKDHPAQWAKALATVLASTYGEAGVREYMRCYYGQVSMMDWCFGRLLKALDELGLADHTLVIFTSDHGNMLGQHGMVEKAVTTFYDDLMRVPFLMRLPGKIPEGKIMEVFASSVDVAPTILDLVGAPPLAKIHGRSLRPFFAGKADDQSVTFGERGDLSKTELSRMIRTRQWKLNLHPAGQKELFDLLKDPDEIHNLAGDAAQATTIRQLSEQLREHMRIIGDPAVSKFNDDGSSK